MPKTKTSVNKSSKAKAKKRVKRLTSKAMPGSGQAKRAARAVEGRGNKIDAMIRKAVGK